MDITDFLNGIRQFGEEDLEVDSIIMVGSYARGEEKPDSDVDLVIITEKPEKFLKNEMFVSRFGEVRKIEKEYWGRVTSLRTWYDNGLEVEFGITTPIWYSRPLDSGTLRALTDGYKVIIDKKDSFLNII